MDSVPSITAPVPVQLPSDIQNYILNMKEEAECYDNHRVKTKKMSKELKFDFSERLIRKLDDLIFECEICNENLEYSSASDYDINNERLQRSVEKLHDFQDYNNYELSEVYHKCSNCPCDDYCVSGYQCLCTEKLACHIPSCPCITKCVCSKYINVIDQSLSWTNNNAILNDDFNQNQ